MNQDQEPRITAKSISMSHETLRKGKERAAMFKLKFSHYISHLIDRDYDTGSNEFIIEGRKP